MLGNTEEPTTFNEGMQEKISAFNSKMLRRMADEKIININEYVYAMGSKVSNNWMNKLCKCKDCIRDAKDQCIGDIIPALKTDTYIISMIFV